MRSTEEELWSIYRLIRNRGLSLTTVAGQSDDRRYCMTDMCGKDNPISTFISRSTRDMLKGYNEVYVDFNCFTLSRFPPYKKCFYQFEWRQLSISTTNWNNGVFEVCIIYLSKHLLLMSIVFFRLSLHWRRLLLVQLWGRCLHPLISL